jgi:hypothetical protein
MGWDLHQAYWKEPYSHTPLMAGIQFYIRILILEMILSPWTRREFSYNPEYTPQHSFGVLHSQWLVKNEGTVFAELHDQLNYDVKINLGYKSQDRMYYSRDNKICYFGTGVIEI